jgi:outer membrane lipoprotein-sorting protein
MVRVMNLASRTLLKTASAAALGALGVYASFAPTAAIAQSQPANAQLEEAVGALRAITTLKADFTQTDRNGQRVSGTLTLKRPGRIRFQYAPGVPILIVSDGSALTFID